MFVTINNIECSVCWTAINDNQFKLNKGLLKNTINIALEESGLDYTKAQMYKIACSDLSDLSDVKYDVLVFFSPTGVKSLLHNFPKFKQKIQHYVLKKNPNTF